MLTEDSGTKMDVGGKAGEIFKKKKTSLVLLWQCQFFIKKQKSSRGYIGY